MPRVQTAMGEVIVFDGTNAAELATAVGAPGTPTADAHGAVTLGVPLTFGSHQSVTLAPGDGLAVREAMGGFLPITADQIAEFTQQPAAKQPGSTSTAPPAAATVPAAAAAAAPATTAGRKP